MWVFGGGNTAGSISDPTYNGCNLATDSIVVSINYRLGPLGFLALDSFGIGGNFGTQDQLLGLNWIQNNIRAFGGDPVSLATSLMVDLTICSHKSSFLDNRQEQSTLMSLDHYLKLPLSSTPVSLNLAVVEHCLHALPKMRLVRDMQPA